MRRREAMKEQIGEGENEMKKPLLVAFSWLLQVALLPTAGVEGERRRKRLRSVHFQLLAAAREPTHR